MKGRARMKGRAGVKGRIGVKGRAGMKGRGKAGIKPVKDYGPEGNSLVNLSFSHLSTRIESCSKQQQQLSTKSSTIRSVKGCGL